MPRDKKKKLVWHFQAGYGWYTDGNKFTAYQENGQAGWFLFGRGKLLRFRTLAEAKAHAETLAA